MWVLVVKLTTVIKAGHSEEQKCSGGIFFLYHLPKVVISVSTCTVIEMEFLFSQKLGSFSSEGKFETATGSKMDGVSGGGSGEFL